MLIEDRPRPRLRTVFVVMVVAACGAAAALPAVVGTPPERHPATVATAPPGPPHQAPRAAPHGAPLTLPHDRSQRLSPEQVQGLMVQAGFPPEEIGTGVALSLAESDRVPDSVNARASVGTDRGLWQINDHYWDDELAGLDWQDPAHNTSVALAVWRESGWDAWAAYDPDTMDGAPLPDPAVLPHQAARTPTTDR